jgi:predicted ferric reductase
MDARLKKRRVGGFTVVSAGGAVVVLWIRQRPVGLPNSYFWGELAGVVVVYLLTCSVVLASRSRWLEPWFGGLDRMYLWHKHLAIAAMPLLAPHVLLTGSTPTGSAASKWGLALGVVSLIGLLALILVSLPRLGRILHLPYERWIFIHRLTGLFLVSALLHGIAIDHIVASSGLLKGVYIAIGTVGVSAYMYDELFMRRRVPSAEYTIATVDRPNENVVELHLTPKLDGVVPRAGQFIFLSIGGDDAWREHPFSIAGKSSSGELRLSIRALGRDTQRMHDRLEPGLPATVSGPYGMFDFTLGGSHQIWIAGGIGAVPFLSWLERLEPEDAYSIDFFYTVPEEAQALYLSQLELESARLPSVRIHTIYSRTDGHLTGKKLVEEMGPLSSASHAFLCGPVGMVDDLTHDLRRAGVPRDFIHSEHFSFR